MIDYKIEKCKESLSKISKEFALKMIYTWVKQAHINFKQFKELLLWLEE